MATSGDLLEAASVYWTNVGTRSLEVMQGWRESIRVGKLRPRKILSDSLSLWLEATEGWYAALFVGAAPQVPLLFMSIPSDAQANTATVKAHVPGDAKLKMTSLVSHDKKTLPEKALRLEGSSKGNELSLSLKGLKTAKPNPGTYIGFVYTDQKAIAQVVVEVTKPSGGSPPGVAGPRSRTRNRQTEKGKTVKARKAGHAAARRT
jgi:hypothetical protein